MNPNHTKSQTDRKGTEWLPQSFRDGLEQRQLFYIAGVTPEMVVFTPIRVLGDGAYLAKLYRNAADRKQDRDGILVRIIEYTFDDPGRPGSGPAGPAPGTG